MNNTLIDKVSAAELSKSVLALSKDHNINHIVRVSKFERFNGNEYASYSIFHSRIKK